MQENLRFEEFVDQVIKNICKVFPDSVIEDDFKVIQIKQLNSIFLLKSAFAEEEAVYNPFPLC